MTGFGIDIGGTGIKGAPVDTTTGELTAERFRLDTPSPSKPEAVAQVVKQVVAHHNWNGPVGITFPGVVVGGKVLTAANVDKTWTGFDADTFFTGVLGMPVHLMNDADAAGVAEMRFGAGRGHDGVVIMVTLGTGIGTAVFYKGVLIPNTELGHIEMNGKDAETLASGRAEEKDDLSWKDYAKRVEKYLRRLDALMWPDLFIIGGGVSKESARWLPLIDVRPEVRIAHSLNSAGIIGAALLTPD